MQTTKNEISNGVKTYRIYTLGCKVNQYDSGRLASELARIGFLLGQKNADLAIINSCAVTKTAVIKSGRMIKLAKKENPKAKIVLAGCWPKAEDIKESIADVDFIMKVGNSKELIKLISKSQIPITKQIPASPAGGPNPNNQNNKVIVNNEKARYFIKIQDGCEQFCSYCIIPYTRGKLKSRGEEEVIAEIKQAVKAGYEEIVLSGIHLGLYGKERILSLRGASATKQSLVNARVREIAALPSVARNDNLAGLLKKLISINGLGRIRLSSIEITEVADELIKLMAESNKICQHLHIPLQSGSNKILKLMNRPYDVAYFKNKIKQIKRAMPDIAITTDVIVGFPGETAEDFRHSLKLIKQIKFSRLHVFPFSTHAKLPAAKLPGQVSEKIKARRAKILRSLGLKLAEDYKKKFKGRELAVVAEQIEKDKIIGKTEYYFDIEFKKRQIISREINESRKLIGQIIKAKNN